MLRLRMKRLGRRHRPFYRLVAVDQRAARDGKVIEYLGHYDPSITESDARAILKKDRIDYWLSVGAQPSEKVSVLIKKYGTNGTHLSQQEESLQRLAASKPTAPAAVAIAKPEEAPAEEASAEAATGEEAAPEASGEGEAKASAAEAESAGEESASEEKTE